MRIADLRQGGEAVRSSKCLAVEWCCGRLPGWSMNYSGDSQLECGKTQLAMLGVVFSCCNSGVLLMDTKDVVEYPIMHRTRIICPKCHCY